MGPNDFGGSDYDCGFETGWDRMMREETMPMVQKAMRSEIERHYDLSYSDLTAEETASVDRIKSGYALLSRRERAGSPTDVIMDLSVAIASELRRSAQIATTEQGQPSVGHALVRLNDAICQRERDGGAGHTLVLIPNDPAERVSVSLDGKPVDVSIERAIEVAFIARTGTNCAPAPADEWFPVPGATGVRARALIPPGGKVGVYLLEFEPGGKIDVHKHPQTESLFVQSGFGTIDTGKTNNLVSGEVNYVGAHTYHAIVAGSEGMKLISVATPDWSAT